MYCYICDRRAENKMPSAGQSKGSGIFMSTVKVRVTGTTRCRWEGGCRWSFGNWVRLLMSFEICNENNRKTAGRGERRKLTIMEHRMKNVPNIPARLVFSCNPGFL